MATLEKWLCHRHPLPQSQRVRRRTRKASSPSVRVSGWRWVPVALLAALAVYAVVASWASRTRAPTRGRVGTAQPAPAAAAIARPVTEKVPGRLVSQQDLRKTPVPLETSLGTLAIATAADGGKGNIVLLNGAAIPGLRDDAVTLVHRAVFSDRGSRRRLHAVR